ncbi:hypothetical protein NPIL_202861 [Nephila pilipes]|uniref:Uncharacterized protein n=1 Tax=Nephila pilipes TaxID=299642 RepID=A0A8X6N6L3_NEPPI|nr:hypothetical protein NPIL_202861 [Nephila pilipes]
MPREGQLDLLTLSRAEAANSVYEKHLLNKRRFDIHRRFHSFKSDLVLFDWPKQSTTPGNRVLKFVRVHHLCTYFKRDTQAIEKDDSSEEESESALEMQDLADDLQDNPDGTGL